MVRWLRWIAAGVIAAVALLPGQIDGSAHGQTGTERVALAYVLDGAVTLAGSDGQPIATPGPTFTYGQGARLFWTPNGKTLYVAREDGLYATGTGGGASVLVTRNIGRTMTIAQDARTLYYLETITPQPLEGEFEGRVSFPFREAELLTLSGGSGRLAGYFGRFEADAARADLSFSAALYARDGGLLFAGRPELFPTYGANVFGTCCFPDPGLGIFNVQDGTFDIFDAEVIPGAAALNLTRTHLAAPTTTGVIRIYDLITSGWRDYEIAIAGGLGTVERLAWSPDDSYLYIVARSGPTAPLTQNTSVPFVVDTRSADITVYRLNLVTSVIRELAWRTNVYGVSSLAATDTYVFATVVLRPEALVTAINDQQIRADALPTDADIMEQYLPTTVLWRIDAAGELEPSDVMANVWGLAARPIR